jgi:hypothetical protein
VRCGEGVELLELLLREIRDEADKLRVVSVELSVQRATSALTVTGELDANGGDLFVAAALVMLDQLFIILGLARQVAIGRLGTDSHRALEELAAEMEANGIDCILIVVLVVRHLLLLQRVGKDLHGVLEELVGENVALKCSGGATCSVRRFGGGNGELITALLHALALLQIRLLTLLGLFLLFALLLEGERHHMALLLIDRELEIGDGTSGGHSWIALLALWYFDSTSFPYPSLWQIFLSIFFER